MAVKRKTKRRTTRRKRTTRRRRNAAPVMVMNPRRRRRKRTTKKKVVRRRRYRRRKNPSFDAKGLALAGAGAVGGAGAGFLLDGTTLDFPTQYAIHGGGGAVVGAILSLLSPDVGKGFAASSIGCAALGLLRHYVVPPFGGQKVTPGKAPQPEPTTTGLGSTVMELSALGETVKQLDLSAVEADLSAIEADLSAVEADLSGLEGVGDELDLASIMEPDESWQYTY